MPFLYSLSMELPETHFPLEYVPVYSGNAEKAIVEVISQRQTGIKERENGDLSFNPMYTTAFQVHLRFPITKVSFD